MQVIQEHKQQKFPDAIPAGNYSGITYLGDERYAVVDDKSAEDGFYVWHIQLDSVTGRVLSAENEGFRTSGQPNRDMEGIAYNPYARTLFISGEADNEVMEYTLDGQHTGRRLNMPVIYRQARGNRGLEALTYDADRRLFWTVNEAPLKGDTLLRLQSFGDDLQPRRQLLYQLDEQQSVHSVVTGVSALCACADGVLLVLERELRVTKLRIGSWAHCRIYAVNTDDAPEDTALTKTLLTEFRTKINLTRRNFANYEGMCFGPALADGSLPLLLIADSQNQNGGILRDWLKVVVVKRAF